MSFRYTRHIYQVRPRSTSSISCLKYAGALHDPKGINLNWSRPFPAENVIISVFGMKVENHLEINRTFHAILGRGTLSFLVISFKHRRQPRSTSMTFSLSISLIIENASCCCSWEKQQQLVRQRTPQFTEVENYSSEMSCCFLQRNFPKCWSQIDK